MEAYEFTVFKSGYCVAPEHFRKGFGIFMMQQIEENFPEVKVFTLDTPIWNVRTNAFYQKLGYSEVRRDGDFVYYEKNKAGISGTEISF